MLVTIRLIQLRVFSAEYYQISTQRPFDARAAIRWSPQTSSRSNASPKGFNTSLTGVYTVRFASTAPVASPVKPTADVAHTTPTSPEFVIDPAPVVTSTSLDSLEFSNIGSANITEHIGYLKELGLNFGWGPTSMMQWYYEHVHILSGLPWWSSILLASLMYRVFVLAVPNAITSDQMARMKSVAPYMKGIQARSQEAGRKNDQMAMLQAQRELSLLKQTAKISFTKQFSLIGIQSFFGYGTFKLMREMAALPVPGLESQGIAWITDLTVPDPLYILPLALAGTMHLVFKLGGPGGGGSELAPTTTDMNAATGHIRSLLLYGLPAGIGIFMLWMPACLQLSFASTSVFGMMQGRLMMKPWFRKATGLWPLEGPTPTLFGPAPSAQNEIGEDARSRAPRALHTISTMAAYQAPTVADVARGVPSSNAPRRGFVGTITRPFSPIARYFSGFWKESKELAARYAGQKNSKQARFEQRAKDHERRRRRELEEDRLYRERMAKQNVEDSR